VERLVSTTSRGWRVVFVLVVVVGCGMRPLQHDGPLTPLASGEAGGRSFKAYGFRRAKQGCVGWERTTSRDVLCSPLLKADEAFADDQMAKGIHRLLGRLGPGVAKIDLVTRTGTISATAVKGQREGYFVTTIPTNPVDEVVLYRADGAVVRRYPCRDTVGYPSLLGCLTPP